MRNLFVTTLLVLLQFADCRIAAQVSFKPPQSYHVGTTPVSAAVADINGDGVPDLVVANQGSNDVSVLLGKGDGTLRPPVNFAAGVSPTGVVVTDINGDGRPDIAVLVSGDPLNSIPGAVSMLLGNGDGTFQSPIVLTLILDQQPFTLVDVNGDKKADLIVNVTDSSGDPIAASVSLGKGDGTFQNTNTVPNIQGVALVSDLDKDGRPDLTSNGTAPSQIMYGNGDGTFSRGPQVAPADQFIGRIWSVDLNGDGQADLILESSSETGPSDNDVAQHIGVFLSSPSFGNEQIFLTGGSMKPLFKPPIDFFITDVVTGDFNGDGKIDVANRSQPSSVNPPFAVNLGDGAGNFTMIPLTDPGPLAAAADLNRDQLTDLVVLDAANNNIAVLLNSTPSFTIDPVATTLTTSAGQQVTDTLTISGVNGFSSPLQLSCQVTGPTPLPACSLSPDDVTSGTTPVTATLTLAPASSARLISPMKEWRWRALYALTLPLAFLGLGSGQRRHESKRWLMIALLGVTSLGYTACGRSSNTQSVHDPKSYAVQVTAASAALTKNLRISLTVQ